MSDDAINLIIKHGFRIYNLEFALVFLQFRKYKLPAFSLKK